MFYCEDCDRHYPEAQGTGQQYCPECGAEPYQLCSVVDKDGWAIELGRQVHWARLADLDE